MCSTDKKKWACGRDWLSATGGHMVGNFQKMDTTSAPASVMQVPGEERMPRAISKPPKR